MEAFPEARIIPFWHVAVYSLYRADPGVAYSSPNTARGDGVMGSEARTPRRVGSVWPGPATGEVGQGGFPGGGSAAPELAAGPMSQSCPTSLFLSPLAATAPDFWRQSREACGPKRRC